MLDPGGIEPVVKSSSNGIRGKRYTILLGRRREFCVSVVVPIMGRDASQFLGV